MEYNRIKAVVNNYGVEMTAKMIAILQSQGSKNLVSQIDHKVIEDMNLIILEIGMPSYGYYASEGRKPGKMPPLDDIKVWMESRNIDLAALYPISRKIASIGTKASARHFLKEFKLTTDFENKVLDAYMEDVKTTLAEFVNKINNEN